MPERLIAEAGAIDAAQLAKVTRVLHPLPDAPSNHRSSSEQLMAHQTGGPFWCWSGMGPHAHDSIASRLQRSGLHMPKEL